MLGITRHFANVVIVLAGAALATGVLAACGTDSEDSAAIEEVVQSYLAAIGDGRGGTACELLTPEAQLGIFDFRLVHAGADHPDQACARIVERNRLRGESSLTDVDVTAIEIDGETATASVDGVEVTLERVVDDWKITRFGLAESVVPGDRRPPKPRPQTLS